MIYHEAILNECQEIVLYKNGSRGEVIGRYKSVMDIVDLERKFYTPFSHASVNNCLIGRSKSFTSFNHQCRVMPKIENIK